MKISQVVDMVKQGKKPMVLLTNFLWDESWGEKGMIARVVAVHKEEDDMVELEFDYNEKREHNLGLQGRTWFVDEEKYGRTQGTAFEAGVMKEDDLRENCYLMLADDADFTIINEAEPVLSAYLSSGSDKTYVQWLEEKVLPLINIANSVESEVDGQRACTINGKTFVAKLVPLMNGCEGCAGEDDPTLCHSLPSCTEDNRGDNVWAEESKP